MMNRKELLSIGQQIADRWYTKNLPVIKARQSIERQKKRLIAGKQN